jgi:hypothetical protein
VTNYTEEARKGGIILNTTVTIGYDAPWRDVHAALNDFYVAYELNAYSKEPNLQLAYSALHQDIQDAFSAAGNESMSPHFSALRDGNTPTVPEASRPAGYQAPRFRVGGDGSVEQGLIRAILAGWIGTKSSACCAPSRRQVSSTS